MLMSEYICPNCKNPVYDEEALLCHYCGESLERSGGGFLSSIKYSNKRVTWYFLIFAVLVVFIILVIR